MGANRNVIYSSWNKEIWPAEWSVSSPFYQSVGTTLSSVSDGWVL